MFLSQKITIKFKRKKTELDLSKSIDHEKLFKGENFITIPHKWGNFSVDSSLYDMYSEHLSEACFKKR